MNTLAEIETAADSLPSEENEELRCDLATQAREFAQREHITMDALVATALTAQLDHTPHRPAHAGR